MWYAGSMVKVGTPGKGEARPVVTKRSRFKSNWDYYASRSGPVVVVQAATRPRPPAEAPRYADHVLRAKVLGRDLCLCRYCGELLTMKTANIDHVVPFKHGGRTTLDNLVACCRYCNAAKMNQITVKPSPIGHPSDPFGKHIVPSPTRSAPR